MSGITRYLEVLVKHDGSDLYLSTGAPPSAKFHGELRALGQQVLPPGIVKKLAYEIMDEEQVASFERKPEMNLAISREYFPAA